MIKQLPLSTMLQLYRSISLVTSLVKCAFLDQSTVVFYENGSVVRIVTAMNYSRIVLNLKLLTMKKKQNLYCQTEIIWMVITYISRCLISAYWIKYGVIVRFIAVAVVAIILRVNFLLHILPLSTKALSQMMTNFASRQQITTCWPPFVQLHWCGPFLYNSYNLFISL